MRILLPIFVVFFIAGCQTTNENQSIANTIKESISIKDALEEINLNITKEYEMFTSLKTHYDFKNVVISSDYYENIAELDAFILAVNKGHSATIQINLVNQDTTIKLSHIDNVITYEKKFMIDGQVQIIASVCDSFDKIDTNELTTYVIISNGYIDQVIPIVKQGLQTT